MDEAAVRKYMWTFVEDCVDECGEVNSTKLAELAEQNALTNKEGVPGACDCRGLVYVDEHGEWQCPECGEFEEYPERLFELSAEIADQYERQGGSDGTPTGRQLSISER